MYSSKTKILLLALLLCFTVFKIKAQTSETKTRTKLGLCLSGGGAKGLAHIGILKVFDELGVKPDYITGTSMGSIVGALYAMGYSADSIEKIARSADWPMLLSNRVPFDRITAEEKDESGKYIAEIPYKKFKLTPPTGVIEGQAIIEFLTRLSLPVYCIDSFSRFNIPFLCIGADIVTGEAVQLKGGFLPDALRASMSIPTVFSPVKVNNRLLVDSGLINNFPVKDLKEMGAEIVIGSYTGGNLYNEEEIINSPVKLIYQSSSFVRIAASNEAKQLCRIVIDPEFGKLTIADFYKADSIINLGIASAYAHKNEIKRILDSLGIEQYQRKIQLPSFNDSLEINSIHFKGSILNTNTLSKQRFNIPQKTSIHQLETAVQNLYGTRYFDRVTYSLQPEGNQFNLNLLVKEASNYHLKFAMHYDNELKTGFIINGTIRNLIGKSSRLLLSVDVSENPKLNIHYYKYIGTKENYWLTTQFYSDRNIITTYENGNILGDLINNYTFLKLGINRTMNINSYAQIYLTLNSSNLEERASAKLFYTDGEFSKIKEKYLSIGFESSKNTTKQRYFPKSGKIVLFKYGMHLNINSKTILDNGNELYHVENLPMHRFQIDIRNYHPISKKISFNTSLKGSGILDNNYLISEQQYGGGLDRPMRNLIEFDGYRNYELGGAYAFAFKTEFQFEVYRNIYLQSRINYGVFSNSFDKFFTNVLNPIYNLDLASFHTFSYGINLATLSPLGPIQIGFGEAYPLNKTRFFISFGHKF